MNKEREEALRKQMEIIKKLLDLKITKRADMQVALDKRAAALITLLEQREKDAELIELLETRIKAANSYIAVLALNIEAMEAEKTEEQATGNFEITIPKDEIAEAIKGKRVSWYETEDKTGIVLKIEDANSDEEAQDGEANTQNSDTREADPKGDNDQEASPCSESRSGGQDGEVSEN